VICFSIAKEVVLRLVAASAGDVEDVVWLPSITASTARIAAQDEQIIELVRLLVIEGRRLVLVNVSVGI